MIFLWEDNIPGYNSSLSLFKPYIKSYIVDTNKEHAAFIIFPGGGYTHLADQHEGNDIALWLNSLGISAFVVYYRIYPYKHPYPLLDAKRAIRLVRFNSKKWNINPNKIGVIGFSAGGHLASTLGTHFDEGNKKSIDPVEKIHCRPDAMVLCYPVITMNESTHSGSKNALLGSEPDPILAYTLSNENMVTDKTPTTFLWHTLDDNVVAVENCFLFAEALKKNNVTFEMHIFPHGNHGLGLAKGVPQVENWPSLCANWLKAINFIE
ncbi:alpha/beta hydrolase [Caldicellulosiruptoraceae bacterium PP1]